MPTLSIDGSRLRAPLSVSLAPNAVVLCDDPKVLVDETVAGGVEDTPLLVGADADTVTDIVALDESEIASDEVGVEPPVISVPVIGMGVVMRDSDGEIADENSSAVPRITNSGLALPESPNTREG